MADAINRLCGAGEAVTAKVGKGVAPAQSEPDSSIHHSPAFGFPVRSTP
jgi:hypothetical protein